MGETIEVTCPRCGRGVQQRFYGPCDECRTALRDSFRAEGRVIHLAEYERPDLVHQLHALLGSLGSAAPQAPAAG